MRIIAGQFKSRPLKPVAGYDVRPTSDRLREALFNVLTAGNPEALSGRVFLDIFAGTGAVGIEAISRGAGKVYFLESSAKAVAVIRANVKSLRITEGFDVIDRDALRGLRQLDAVGVRADYVFLDPPYAEEQAYADTLKFLAHSKLVAPETLVIAEHEKHFDPGDQVGPLSRTRLLRQGDATLSLYKSS